jgi:hypothetical protein
LPSVIYYLARTTKERWVSGHSDDVAGVDLGKAASGYRPPTVTYLGTLADLTQKEVGAADGATFLGLDIGSA